MKRTQLLPLLLAVAALLCVHLHPQYRVTVDGSRLPGTYSPAALREGMRAAEAAAEEILRYDAKMPETERSLCIRFRPATDEKDALTAALLQSVSGLTLADSVYVNGIRLGTVADGEQLCERLRAAILGQMPTAAVSGNISGRLELRRVYTRADGNMEYDEMVRRITGMAPVIYLDSGGKLA